METGAAFSRTRRGILVAALAGLTGCGSATPPKTTAVSVKVAADETINPSPSGQSAPVLVRVYALRDEMVFEQSDFSTLYNNDAQALGTAMLAKREMLIAPGASQSFQQELPVEAAFLGFLAAFRAVDLAQWRVLVPLKPEAVNTIQLDASGSALNLTSAKSASKPWF